MSAAVTEQTSVDIAPELGRTLASAFSDDPLTKYFQGHEGSTPKSQRMLERAFEMFAADGLAHTKTKPGKKRQIQTVVHVAKDNKCVALWQMPGPLKEGPIAELRMMFRMYMTLGFSACWRAGSVMRVVEKRHPKEPHMYLKMLGTAADAQGHGFGSIVMREMTKRLDEEGIPAYLESSNEKNLPFYQRHGFEIVHRPIPGLPKGTPALTSMWRKPQPQE